MLSMYLLQQRPNNECSLHEIPYDHDTVEINSSHLPRDILNLSLKIAPDIMKSLHKAGLLHSSGLLGWDWDAKKRNHVVQL